MAKNLNGTWLNYAGHAAQGVGFVLAWVLFGWIVGAGLALGAVVGVVWSVAWFWSREASENAVKRWDAPGRPWADLVPYDRDQWADLISGVVGAVLAAAAVLLVLSFL